MNPTDPEQDSPIEPIQDTLRQSDSQPVKRKRGGRVRGSKNKPKAPPVEPVTEADAKSLREFIREITTGEEFRNGLKDRLKTGKLTAGESRLVEKILDAPVEKKKEGWQELMAVATEQELVLLADLMRRAIAARGMLVKAKGKRVKRVSSIVIVGQESQEPVTAGELPVTAQRVTSNQVASKP